MNSINWPASSIWVFIAQLGEHCSANPEATVSNPVEAQKNFFSGYFRNCLNCDSLRWSHTHFICTPAFYIILFSGVILYQTLECGNNCQERQHLSVRVFLSAVGFPDYFSLCTFSSVPSHILSLWNSSLFDVLRGVTTCLTDGWGRVGFKSSLLNWR